LTTQLGGLLDVDAGTRPMTRAAVRAGGGTGRFSGEQSVPERFEGRGGLREQAARADKSSVQLSVHMAG
jgi:hypothetical protein